MHLGSDFIELLVSLREDSGSAFLVSGSGTNIGDRLKLDLAFVVQWLRNLGIDDRKPLHLLRKEAGSVIATDHPQTRFGATIVDFCNPSLLYCRREMILKFFVTRTSLLTSL